MHSQTFRDDDGTASLGLGLSLQLHYFAPELCFADTTQETQLSTVIQIPCGKFYSFLRTAEVRDKMKRIQQGIKVILPPDCGKSLETTPLEAWRPKQDVDIVSGEAGETARSEAQDPS